jgi:hypothetical protein
LKGSTILSDLLNIDLQIFSFRFELFSLSLIMAVVELVAVAAV